MFLKTTQSLLQPLITYSVTAANIHEKGMAKFQENFTYKNTQPIRFGQCLIHSGFLFKVLTVSILHDTC